MGSGDISWPELTTRGADQPPIIDGLDQDAVKALGEEGWSWWDREVITLAM